MVLRLPIDSEIIRSISCAAHQLDSAQLLHGAAAVLPALQQEIAPPDLSQKGPRT